MWNGAVYPRSRLAPRTVATDSGCWPTPQSRADSRGEGGLASRKDHQVNLHIAVKTWPTPRAQEHGTTNPGKGLCLNDAVWGGKGKRPIWPTPKAVMPDNLRSAKTITPDGRILRESGEDYGMNLQDVVLLTERKMWPTPSARDWKDESAESCQNVPVNGLLGRAVHGGTQTRPMYPTPASVPTSPESHSQVSGQFRTALEQAGIHGVLSPDWTEWLMGLPIQWTATNPLPKENWNEWTCKHVGHPNPCAMCRATSPIDVARVTAKCPNRVGRLRAIGNAQVSLVTATAWTLLFQRLK